MLELLETEIAAQLDPVKAAGIDVVRLPETEAEFERPMKKGKITVAIKQVKPALSLSTSINVQENEVFVELVVQSDKVRGGVGCYAIKAAIDRYVLGYQPSHFDKIKFEEFSYLDYLQGVYSYSYIVSTKGLVIERESDIEYPLISDITLDDVSFESNND